MNIIIRFASLKPAINQPPLWLRQVFAVTTAGLAPVVYWLMQVSTDQSMWILWWLLVLLLNLQVVVGLVGRRYALASWLLSTLALIPMRFGRILELATWSTEQVFALTAMMLLGGLLLLVEWLKERKHDEIIVREQHFRRLVELSVHPMVLKDEKGRVNYVSQSIKHLLGLSPADLIGHELAEFVHEDDREQFEKFHAQLTRAVRQPKSHELRMRKKDGTWLWVKNTAINYRHDSAIKAVVGSFQDISKQKQLAEARMQSLRREKLARQEAEKAVRSRDEFLSIASHELRTPLTTILLQLQATIRQTMTQTLADFSGDTLLKSLTIAEQQSQRLSLMMKDLLNLSLITTGRIELHKQNGDMVSMIRSLAEKLEAQLKLSGSKLTLDLPDQMLGEWDLIRIEQALSNLLTNAMKYGKGKPITISLSKDVDKVLVSVVDQGLGVSDGDRSKIFDLFHRAENGKASKGLGVGLYIVKQIVTSHGGQVKVESSLDKGSRFTLLLPITNKDSEKLDTLADVSQIKKLASKRVRQ